MDDCEVWNNGYELDGSTEILLRRAQIAPLADDEILRLCVKDNELMVLLDTTEKAAQERELISGAAALAFSFGRSNSFGDAIQKNQARMERLRDSFDWNTIPPATRDKARKRADFILDYASQNKWLERDGEKWKLTGAGHALLDGGGFTMK